MSVSKYHHLIPQTYMKSWCFNNKSVYTANKRCLDKASVRNIAKIAGIRNFHTIRAGMMCCKQSDTDKIFSSTKEYVIEFRGEVIRDTFELNKIYCFFDKWNSTIRKIEKNILNHESNTIPEFDKEYLMEFFISLDWRSFESNNNFNVKYEKIAGEGLDLESIEIPQEDRIYPFLKTAYDEIYHCYLLSKYREFLNGTGVIYKEAIQAIDLVSFHFCIAKGNLTFITSDNPGFYFTREKDGLKQGVLAITPNILMVLGKNPTKEKSYYISKVSDNTVKEYNRLILENAVNFIIMDTKNNNYV